MGDAVPTVIDAHRRCHLKGNKSRMSHVDVNDASIMASMTSLTLYGDLRHWRIMGRIITADFILYYCRICP